jgi:predicted DsbA family dithiol-disulfide isomerase
MRLDEYFPVERIEPMKQHLADLAAHFGVSGMRFPERLPNTRRALALAEVARDEGKLDSYRHQAMDAHWIEGLDLEVESDLRTIAGRSGLADGAVERSIVDPQYLRRVAEIREEAGAIGVTGIPTFLTGSYAVVGCQPYGVLEELMRRNSVPRRTEAPD